MKPSDIKSLQDCQLFEGLTDGEVTGLLGISAFNQLSKGEILFKENDESNTLYIVIEGCLGVRRHIIDKKEDNVPLSPVIAEHGAGEAVGEFSFFDDKPRSAEVFAMKDTRALAINPQAFHQFTNEFPKASQKITANILKILICRMRRTDEKLSVALEWGWEVHGFTK
ncbi:MAG: cyclic nucleotide-binding domain-containing protein [Nitrospirota bacterium]